MRHDLRYMRRHSFLYAFTLIELLVVISIIALLLSILMPSLSKVKSQAKRVVCMSQQKQWGVMFSMYTDDNRGSFMPGWDGTFAYGDLWPQALKSYYDDEKICFCPSAKKLSSVSGNMRVHPFTAWGKVGDSYVNMNPDDAGSYGMNDWVYNPPSSVPLILPGENRWGNINNMGRGSEIPLFLDSLWEQGAPFAFSKAPPLESGFEWPDQYDQMQLFSINRHDGYVNCLFVDFSARKVGLKELWKLKWHRNFDTNLGYNEGHWPPWMERFKDY